MPSSSRTDGLHNFKDISLENLDNLKFKELHLTAPRYAVDYGLSAPPTLEWGLMFIAFVQSGGIDKQVDIRVTGAVVELRGAGLPAYSRFDVDHILRASVSAANDRYRQFIGQQEAPDRQLSRG